MRGMDLQAPRTRLLFALPVLGWGVLEAIRLAWLCDDAFISFRVALNAVAGLGPVFNAGERVEGYTNALWTALLTLGLWMGVQPEVLSQVMGVACYAALLVGLAWGSVRAGRFPLAAVALALVKHAQLFATSGLETSLAMLLTTATALGAAQAASPRAWLGVGLLGGLTVMNRPDGALVLGLAGLWALGSGGLAAGTLRARARAGLAVGGGALALLAPWLVWKLSFYGELLPNTWYAKGELARAWTQGLLYLRLFFGTYPAVGLGLVVAALGQPRRLGGLIAALGFLWCLYVIRVGGDFMFARFVLPVTPLALLGLELVLHRLRPPWTLLLSAGALLSVLSAPIPAGLLDKGGISGIVEEKAWYPAEDVETMRRLGGQVAAVLEGTDVKVAFLGTQAMLMYYGRVPWALEAHVGLTDRELARMPPPVGARVGHGIKATEAYLRQRGVDLALDSVQLRHGKRPYERIVLGPEVEGRLFRYDPARLEPLRARGAEFVDFPAYLDAYLAALPSRSDEQVRADYERFRGFYFEVVEDPAREQAFLERVRAR